MSDKLHIGVLLEGHVIPDWQFKSLESLSKSQHIHLILLFFKRDVPDRNDSNIILSTLIESIEITDDKSKSSKRDLIRAKSISDLNHLKSEINTVGIQRDGELLFSEDNLSEIKNFNLHLIINFTHYRLANPLIEIPAIGVWTLKIDSYFLNHAFSSDYWTILKKSPTVNTFVLMNEPGNKTTSLIYKSTETIYPLSFKSNKNRIFSRASLIIPRLIDGLHKYGMEYIVKLKERSYAEIIDIRKASSRSGILLNSFKNISNFLYISTRQVFKKLRFTLDDRWYIMFSLTRTQEGLIDFEHLKSLCSGNNVFWADPFVIQRDEKFYIFVEEYLYDKKKAHISVLELDNKGNLINSKRVIEKPYHMSYPFVFQFNGIYYMIPESSENNTIDLYYCKTFPFEWHFLKNLISNISAVDSTVFFYNNKWWLFTSLDLTGNVTGFDTELFLYFTDDILTGKWESHPLNPVVSDVRSARPAGAVFTIDGNIFRPSQDSSGRYGRALNINQILILTENDYQEKLSYKIETSYNSRFKGTHTYNSSTDFTIIDAYSYRRRYFRNLGKKHLNMELIDIDPAQFCLIKQK